MILADSSIWVAMFRTSAYRAELNNLIESGQLCIHPFLIAELALGGLPQRVKTLTFLEQLTQLRAVTLSDVRDMIEKRRLFSKGIGLIDAHLVASCLLTPGVHLWTLDESLSRVAESLGILARLP